MGSLGPFELILIFLVILLVFGAKRIPEIARGLGKGIREFKSATSEIQRELTIEEQKSVQQPRPPAQAATPRSDYGQQEYQQQAAAPASEANRTEQAS